MVTKLQLKVLTFTPSVGVSTSDLFFMRLSPKLMSHSHLAVRLLKNNVLCGRGLISASKETFCDLELTPDLYVVHKISLVVVKVFLSFMQVKVLKKPNCDNTPLQVEVLL